MAYATIAEIKAQFQKTDNTHDAILGALLDAASRTIDRVCNRPLGFEASDRATARYYPGNGKAFILIDEFIEATAVAVKDSPTDTTYEAWTTPTSNMAGDGDWMAFSGGPQWPDFTSLPYNALMVDPNGDQSAFTSGLYTGMRGFPRRTGSLRRQVPTVQVTARWGYSEDIPSDIKQACIMQSMIWFKRQQGSMAHALASDELGVLEVFSALDPAVELILRLGRYMKPPTGRR